jgi:hypothetical protein
MGEKTKRETIDLDAYPDLLVMNLGIRARTLRGMFSILRLGPQIAKSVAAKPDGLLRHDGMMYSLFPLHVGMRQYWRDLDSMLAWSTALPHQAWWKNFVKIARGTTFWHETYFKRGGFEALYDDLPEGKRNFGLASFANVVPAVGSTFAPFRKAARAELTTPAS